LTSREYYPTDPSRPAAASQLLSWASAPYSTREIRRSTLRGLCLPATFRLQGLVTLLTVSSLRTRAGLVSYRRRSWDSPFGAFSSREGVRYVSARTHPLTVSPAAIPSAEARDRHGRPRFLGFDPSGNPWRPSVCLAHRALDAPLGFALLGSWKSALAGISPDLLSRALPGGQTARRHLRVSISTLPRLIRPRGKPRVWMRPPFEGSCTGLILSIRAKRPFWLCVHLAHGNALLHCTLRSSNGTQLYQSCQDSA